MELNNQQKVADPVSYNLAGIQPVKATFHIDCDRLAKSIRDVCSNHIDGISDITYEYDKTNGNVYWYLWFPANSDHFMDKRTSNTPLGKPLRRYSKEFIEFAKKYGWRPSDDGQGGKDEVNINAIVKRNSNPEVAKLNCLQIAINPFIAQIFDMYKTSYQEEFGKSPPEIKLYREWNFRSGPSGKYHALIGLTVEKYLLAAYRNREKPRANRSANFT